MRLSLHIQMILTAPMYTVYGHESQEDKAKEIIVISHKKGLQV